MTTQEIAFKYFKDKYHFLSLIAISIIKKQKKGEV